MRPVRLRAAASRHIPASSFGFARIPEVMISALERASSSALLNVTAFSGFLGNNRIRMAYIKALQIGKSGRILAAKTRVSY
jgi:hypothetical protein